MALKDDFPKMISDLIEFQAVKTIEDVNGLYWVKSDNGAWQGPSQEWPKHKEMIQKYVKDFTCVVQAGGNLGMYPKLMSRMFQHVYTFEPDSLNFQVLSLNCEEENIYKIQAGLGENAGMISMNRLAMTNVGMHRVGEAKGNIPLMKLDDFRFEKLNLIFLDIELYEVHALAGAVQQLAVHKPVVIIENPSDKTAALMKAQNYYMVESYLAEGIYIPN